MENSKKNNKDSSDKNSDTLNEMLNEAEFLMDEDLNSLVGKTTIDQLFTEDVFDIADKELAEMAKQNQLKNNAKPIDKIQPKDKFDTIEERFFELDKKNNSIKSLSQTAIVANALTEDEKNLKPKIKNIPNQNSETQLAKKNTSNVQSNQDTLKTKDFNKSIDGKKTNQSDTEENLSLVTNTNEMQSQTTTEETVQIKDLNIQIQKLWSENESMKSELAFISSSSNGDAALEEVELIQKENYRTKKFIRSLQSDHEKGSFLTYVALGTALLSLIVGGGLGLLGYQAYSNSKDNSDRLALLKEQSTFSSNQLSTATFDKKIRLLTAKNDALSRQFNDLKKNETPDILNPEITDLKKQNKQNQSTIEKLLNKVDSLEKRKPSSATTLTSATPKPVIQAKPINNKSGIWTINLVSFKNVQDAQKKIKEFEKKGVSAKMIQIKIRNNIWYRLRVEGFATKAEAQNFAKKVKNKLKTNSAWISKI